MDDKGNGEKPSVYSNRSKIHSLQIAMATLKSEQVERFRREQQMLDQHLDEKLAARDKGIKESLASILELLTAAPESGGAPEPGGDTSATIRGPGIILSQKQVVTGVSVLIAIVALKVLGIDSDTIASFVIGIFTP